MCTEETFQGLLDYWGEETPDREAIFDGLRRMSYRELKEETQQLAAALSQLHLQKGDKVLTFIPNWHEFMVLFFALAKLGAVLIPCNFASEKEEISDRLQKIKPKAVFVARQSHLTWLQAYEDSSAIITVRFEEEGYLSFSNLLKSGRNRKVETVEINPYDDVFVIMFTSGSTGCPKGVELTYENLFHAAKNIGYRLECTGQDTFLVPMPCCHMFGIVTGMLVPFFFGGKIVLLNRFSPQKALALIEQEKITVIYGVPTMFIRELHEYSQNKTDVSSLRTGIIAGANSDENILLKIRSEFDCDVMVAYGSTESVAVSMTSFQDDIDTRIQTVGRPYDGVVVKVVDDNGEAVEPGEVGELVCKGFGVMKGYYLMPNETAKVLDDKGWLHTGDLATVDQLGYIRIVGRKKDMIIRGGYNIYPAEVEKIYYGHPAVLEVCVLGVPHEELGEQTHAFIQLKENSQETEESLREYAKGKITKYKIPDRVVLLNIMPKLENGKINKKVIEQTCFLTC
ncbi:class I adenylate-forming enzyme family protein [Desulfitobacterium sp.]|uniref:class I adenylate-forming enzyme family protein n=1 Tax=Desulfitobacterium sp. TaxID=49981 RepID=UPI002B67E3E5|nr:class I adenylate-forming enzyme family protein [Desulfitobacterium sp.]HVJ49672.1 class I adenylate-forming enzyme family protein [Desulfitobacterium sp.]